MRIIYGYTDPVLRGPINGNGFGNITVEPGVEVTITSVQHRCEKCGVLVFGGSESVQ